MATLGAAGLVTTDAAFTRTPTITVQSGAGTSATATLAGNDLAGVITLTSGSGSVSTGAMAIVSFTADFSWGTGVVLFAPVEADAAAEIAKFYAAVDETNSVPSGFTLYTRAALSTSTEYKLAYMMADAS